jgi:hypothetical protein
LFIRRVIYVQWRAEVRLPFFDTPYIEDITRRREDMNFIFEL